MGSILEAVREASGKGWDGLNSSHSLACLLIQFNSVVDFGQIQPLASTQPVLALTSCFIDWLAAQPWAAAECSMLLSSSPTLTHQRRNTHALPLP